MASEHALDLLVRCLYRLLIRLRKSEGLISLTGSMVGRILGISSGLGGAVERRPHSSLLRRQAADLTTQVLDLILKRCQIGATRESSQGARKSFEQWPETTIRWNTEGRAGTFEYRLRRLRYVL
jgi:hypothetical protein